MNKRVIVAIFPERDLDCKTVQTTWNCDTATIKQFAPPPLFLLSEETVIILLCVPNSALLRQFTKGYYLFIHLNTTNCVSAKWCWLVGSTVWGAQLPLWDFWEIWTQRTGPEQIQWHHRLTVRCFTLVTIMKMFNSVICDCIFLFTGTQKLHFLWAVL